MISTESTLTTSLKSCKLQSESRCLEEMMHNRSLKHFFRYFRRYRKDRNLLQNYVTIYVQPLEIKECQFRVDEDEEDKPYQIPECLQHGI